MGFCEEQTKSEVRLKSELLHPMYTNIRLRWKHIYSKRINITEL